MTVPHTALIAILDREMGIGCQAFGEFGFDSLSQKLARVFRSVSIQSKHPAVCSKANSEALSLANIT
jgi:hypothetical protein